MIVKRGSKHPVVTNAELRLRQTEGSAQFPRELHRNSLVERETARPLF